MALKPGFDKIDSLLSKRMSSQRGKESEAAAREFKAEAAKALTALTGEGSELMASITAEAKREVRGRRLTARKRAGPCFLRPRSH